MTKTRIAAGIAAVLLLLALGLVFGPPIFRPAQDLDGSPPTGSPTAHPEAAGFPPGAIFGRVTTVDGNVYEGRLRWGGDEEAFWGDYFNGFKDQNPWVAHVPPDRRPTESRPLEVLGIRIADRERPVDLGRPFMARFGDIVRIEAHGDGVGEAIRSGPRFDPRVRVSLKSGSVFDLDRLNASDLDDGVRVWDAHRGTVDLEPRRIRSIELLPAPGPAGEAALRLHGTVRTDDAEFTGFLQWDRDNGVGSDLLDGRTADGPVGLRFDAIGSIQRRPGGGVRVTLRDGGETVLFGGGEVGEGNRGIYVDDPRYGRVLVSWDAFRRLDLDSDLNTASAGAGASAGAAPAYGDFPPGAPLAGQVTTRDGRRLAGRLVFDLDESETTETLDAPLRGVDYTIPLGRIAAITPRAAGAGAAGHAQVTLHTGEVLQLERAGDLGDGNAGLLVFTGDGGPPEYLPWNEVARIDLHRPAAQYPPLDLPPAGRAP